MMLTRVSKLRLRVFRDFTWPAGLHPFGQFNVIYGWNGCGKTTLSWLLSLVEKKTALSEGEAVLEIDNTTKVAGSAFASARLPQVRVFNRDFVSATLSQTGGIMPIYFLGEDSIEKQNKVEQLKKELAATNAALQAAQAAKVKAESKLDDFCKDKAKIIKELLTTANSRNYNNYDKRSFRRALDAMDLKQVEIARLSDEQKAKLNSQKNAQPKPQIGTLVVPPIDLDVLTSDVDTLVNRSVVAQTLDELAGNVRLAKWVQEGLNLHSGDNTSDTCRFCLQPIQAARRSVLEAHFNDAFASFQCELSSLLSKLKAAKQAIGSLSIPDASRFYEALEAEVSATCTMVEMAQADIKATLDVLVARIEAKRDQPFAPVSEQEFPTVKSLSITDSVIALNKIVEKHNHISQEFKASVDSACKSLEASYIAEAYSEFVQISEAVKIAASEVHDMRTTYTRIQAKINELERN